MEHGAYSSAPPVGASSSSSSPAAPSTALPMPPSAIARVSPGNIRSLILEKEKELHDINEYRIRTLETLLREKESAAQAYKHKFSKLQEDFKYNLKLLEGRDEELALYDANFASLKSVLREREGDVSELRAQLADVQAELKQEQKRASEQEAFLQQKLKDARAQMEGARWNFDEELRRVRDEMETARRKMERQMREQQEDLETQRREITVTFDDVMRQRESEFKQTVDELQSRARELELKLKATQRESDMTKERCEELKGKMENMQQLLSDSEKQAKAMEWELADVRTSKDAKVAELEDEILKLQDVKQSLLDEYEGKMAELLQSLHSVEKAFVQQKAQYEEELQGQLRKKDEDAQSLTVRMDSKVQSLIVKLRTTEEQCEKLQADMKQLKWESEDKLLEKDREIDRLQQQASDADDQKQTILAEMKQQLWGAERETLSLQEKVKELTLQLQAHKEKEKLQRQDLAECMEKQEALKREIVTLNLRWENKYQEQEQELSTRHDTRVRELQQARERLLSEKQAIEDRLLHSDNELHRLRAELMSLKSEARINASFGSPAVNSNAHDQRKSHDSNGSLPAPSPLWSDDAGTLSPITGISPLLTESPQGGRSINKHRPSNEGLAGTLQAENTKLKDLIHQMRDALAQQAQDLTNANSPTDDTNTAARLQNAEKQCALLEAKLHEAEARLAATLNSSNGAEIREQLTLCEAELIQAKRSIEEKNRRIAELEQRVQELEQGQQETGIGANEVVMNMELADAKRKLTSAHADIDRLVKERTQLMELSNQLTAELRKLQEAPANGQHPSRVEFAGKKDYENLIADLTRSLEESRVHNKTLKKELRRMVKLQVLNSQQENGESRGGTDGERSRTTSMAKASTSGDDARERRRSSTLSMMKSLDAADSRRSSMASSIVSGTSSAAPSTFFDEELLSLVRSKTTNPARGASATASSLRLQKRSSSGAAIPPSIPEDDEAVEDDKTEVEENRAPSLVNNNDTTDQAPHSSLSALFSRERFDSMASSASESAPVTDARMRLQQAKEMLLLAGKKAERSASLASLAPAKLSDRATPSQKSAIKKLKDLQSKRAEMVHERKKVRNYSMAT